MCPVIARLSLGVDLLNSVPFVTLRRHHRSRTIPIKPEKAEPSRRSARTTRAPPYISLRLPAHRILLRPPTQHQAQFGYRSLVQWYRVSRGNDPQLPTPAESTTPPLCTYNGWQPSILPDGDIPRLFPTARRVMRDEQAAQRAHLGGQD